MEVNNINKLEKSKKKRKFKEKLQKFKDKAIKYGLGLPIYYVIYKPCKYVSDEYIASRDDYYSKRFQTVERKAMDEIKKYVLLRISARSDGDFSISENKTIEDDEDLNIKKFLETYSPKYKEKGRKYSRMYGKLFPDQIDTNYLKYTNNLIMWLLDNGCSIEYFSFESGIRTEEILIVNYD